MKTLITGALRYNKEKFEKLENVGLEIIYVHDETKKLEINVDEIEFVICNSLFLYNDIKKFKNLKAIQLTSAGLDRVSLDYIKDNNIKIYNARGVYSIPMAEWTVLKILEIYKNSKKFWKQQEGHIWKKDRNILELNGRTATIVGFGNVGQEIAKRLKAFNVKINAIDLKKNNSEYQDNFYLISEINEVIKVSDILILTLPLTKETEGIINKEKLMLMKENSVLVNISRGKIINEKDLLEVLEEKNFLGVILDVFKDEPLDKDSKLWDFENVIVTPHNSFVGENNNERLLKLIHTNINKLLNS